MPNKVSYIAKSGKKQWKPSLKYIMAMNALCQGFCLACGKPNDNVEPDARRYVCQKCNQPKVYGGDELASMGLVY